MKTLYKIFLALFVVYTLPSCEHQSDILDSEEVIEITNNVVKWQVDNYPRMNDYRIWASEGDLSWENAVFLTAMAEWAEYTSDEELMSWCKHIADTNKYELLTIHGPFFADDMVIAGFYARLFRHYGDSAIIAPSYMRMRTIVTTPIFGGWDLEEGHQETKNNWSWCDALYMEPHVLAEYSHIFGDDDLMQFMHDQYQGCYDRLFCKEDSLWFRDTRYYDRREANGSRIFWGRGNSWVIAGLARLIPLLPEDSKQKYIDLYKLLATRVIHLQLPSGGWSASLLDPDSYPNEEMSCTGLFTYALWWGVNNGLLGEEALTAAKKGWRALVSHVHPDGKLGFVQPIGEDPKAVTEDMAEVYGAAAFSMTARQILIYNKK